MSESLPEEYPLVSEAEKLVHQAYESRMQLKEEYEHTLQFSSATTAIGAAALLAGGLVVANTEPSHFGFAMEGVGYVYVATGVLSAVAGISSAIRAGYLGIRLRRHL